MISKLRKLSERSSTFRWAAVVPLSGHLPARVLGQLVLRDPWQHGGPAGGQSWRTDQHHTRVQRRTGFHRHLLAEEAEQVFLKALRWTEGSFFKIPVRQSPYLLPVCGEECFWPAYGRPAGCWSRSSWRSCGLWRWWRFLPWGRWGRTPRSRSTPPGRTDWELQRERWVLMGQTQRYGQ